MNEQFLELELRLLILQFGRQKVMRVIARLGEQTVEELEQQLRSKEEQRRTKRIKPSIMDLVSSECRNHPEIDEPLRLLAVGFQNRTFLPHLRDVQRFLDRAGSITGKLRSRDDAAPILFRTLASLTRDELLQLVSNNASSGDSDYSLLAREIMKMPSKEQGSLSERGDKPTKD